MIEYYSGTVFNTDAKAIVNTVNTVGVMAAGLALEMALRYPEMYEQYKDQCEKNLLRTGKVSYFKDKSGITIVNFPTKWHFKYPSQLKWIDEGLEDFVSTYKANAIESVAFPKLGCLNGGLSWIQVKPLMEKYLQPLDLKVYVCTDEDKAPVGKEKQMVDSYNAISIKELSKNIKLTKKQIDLLKEYHPIDRFWKLSKIKGIGPKTYSAVFNYFYNLGGVETPKENEQIGLFD